MRCLSLFPRTLTIATFLAVALAQRAPGTVLNKVPGAFLAATLRPERAGLEEIEKGLAGAEEPPVQVMTAQEVLRRVDPGARDQVLEALAAQGWSEDGLDRHLALARRGITPGAIGTGDFKVYADRALTNWIMAHPQLRNRTSKIVGGLPIHVLRRLFREPSESRAETILIGWRQGVDGWLSRAIGTNQSHRLVLVVDPAQDASSVPILPILLQAGDLKGQVIRLSDIDFAAGPITTIVLNGQTVDLYRCA